METQEEGEESEFDESFGDYPGQRIEEEEEEEETVSGGGETSGETLPTVAPAVYAISFDRKIWFFF